MMESQLTPREIVDKMMLTDRFSQWLGIEILVADKGYSKIKMIVRKEMVNGFDIIHGGVTFSFADSALAFASNAHGRLSVALEVSISFPASVKVGDTLIAEAIEFNCSNKIAIYNITVTNQHNEKVALFKGTVYRTSKVW
jgi:acyl-CoA thioesterase